MITFILACIISIGTGSVTCVSVNQDGHLRTFVPGDNVTLVCRISEYYENFYSWFKQSPGEAPFCIVTVYAESDPVRYGAFKSDERFIARKLGVQFTLTITDIRQADSGIYYCAARDYDLIIFSNGVFLKYNDQFMSLEETDPVHPGDSVTLQCSVPTKGCAGEHSVYWFRHDSGESHPGIIYTHGGSSDQCNKSSEMNSSTQSCIYNLPKTNLSTTDAGTYYCAVAMCGEILFGNGSRLDITEPKSFIMHMMVPVLAASNMVCFIIIAVLLCTRTKKRNMTGQPEGFLPTASMTENIEREEMSYTAIHLSARKSKSGADKREPSSHVIYSAVKGLE